MNQSDLKFKLKEIDILEFSLKDPGKEFNRKNVFRFDTCLEQISDVDNKLITIVCSFNIYSDSRNISLGDAKISITYQLDDSELVDQKGNFELPEQFILMLNSISLSTCRGVLYALFRGTHLQNVILPIINPNNLPPNS